MKKIDPVFLISLSIVLVLVLMGAVVPQTLESGTSAVHEFILERFGFAYLLSGIAFLAFCLFLAAGKYGRIKLGADLEKPQYSYFAWFSMLFAAGMGIGLIFWGVAEPLSHFINPPEYLTGGTAESAAFAMRYSFFHWGIHPWAIYIVMSLSLAYFSFRRGMPPLISSCFFPLIGDRIYGPIGKAIDIMAVFATVFGVATSLGLGALQIGGGLSEVFGVPAGMSGTLVIIMVVTVLYLISSMTGLDKGIQILSRGNVLIAVVLLACVTVVGPTIFIFDVFTDTLGAYLSQLLPMSLTTAPFAGFDWINSWTIFYWAWWISWSPFVGLFVASISRGRTVREFILGALIVPSLLTFIWFSVFGGAALHLELYGSAAAAEAALLDSSTALFTVLRGYPLSGLLSVIAMLLLSVFFITSADSATFVLAMMTSRGSFSPPLFKRIGWGVVQSSAAAVLLLSGGLEALQRMAIIAALPFMAVMLLMMHSLLRAMRYELTVESDAAA